MTRRALASCLVILVALALAGCDRSPSTPTAPRAAARETSPLSVRTPLYVITESYDPNPEFGRVTEFLVARNGGSVQMWWKWDRPSRPTSLSIVAVGSTRRDEATDAAVGRQITWDASQPAAILSVGTCPVGGACDTTRTAYGPFVLTNSGREGNLHWHGEVSWRVIFYRLHARSASGARGEWILAIPPA